MQMPISRSSIDNKLMKVNNACRHIEKRAKTTKIIPVSRSFWSSVFYAHALRIKKITNVWKALQFLIIFLYRKSIMTLRRWCQISGRRYKAGKNSRHWLPSLETCFFIVRVINVWTWRKLRSGLSDKAIERRRSTVKPSDQTVTAQSLSVSMNGRVASRES